MFGRRKPTEEQKVEEFLRGAWKEADFDEVLRFPRYPEEMAPRGVKVGHWVVVLQGYRVALNKFEIQRKAYGKTQIGPASSKVVPAIVKFIVRDTDIAYTDDHDEVPPEPTTLENREVSPPDRPRHQVGEMEFNGVMAEGPKLGWQRFVEFTLLLYPREWALVNECIDMAVKRGVALQLDLRVEYPQDLTAKGLANSPATPFPIVRFWLEALYPLDPAGLANNAACPKGPETLPLFEWMRLPSTPSPGAATT
jgi:hypothetical protein